MEFLGALARRSFDRIGARLALVLAIALLPLAVVSAVRSITIVAQSQARSEAALEGETLRAISRELALIEEARGISAALAATIPTLMDDPQACSALMRRVIEATPFSFAGFREVNGELNCSTADGPRNIGVNALLAAQIENPVPTVLMNPDGQISETSVIYASTPIFDPDGTLLGFANVSLPHTALGASDGHEPFPLIEGRVPDVAFFTFNGQGALLTTTGVALERAAQVLPEGMSGADIVAQRRPFSARAISGRERAYSVVPVLSGQIYAVGTWLEEQVIEDRLFFRWPALFPALMWLASLVVAYVAAELLVTRHVRRLQTKIRNFEDTRRGVAAEEFAEAPVELRDMAGSYRQMTDTILREEAELEDTVRQKDILLREVHHRVKNNLQLIASIMNMQMRKSRSDEARTLMRGLHDRVMSLATVHKGLYQTSGLADVRADELLSDIFRQITHLGTFDNEAVLVKQELDEVHLTPDQAVPLTLLVTEALTNAMKYIGSPDSNRPRIRIALRVQDDGLVRVEVANTVDPENRRPPVESSGLGTQLLSAFSQQLRGKLVKENTEGWFVVTVTFEPEELQAKPLELPPEAQPKS